MKGVKVSLSRINERMCQCTWRHDLTMYEWMILFSILSSSRALVLSSSSFSFSALDSCYRGGERERDKNSHNGSAPRVCDPSWHRDPLALRDRDIVERPPRDSFIKFRRADYVCLYTGEELCIWVSCAMFVCNHIEIRISQREEKQRAEMKPEGSIVDFIGNVPGTVISLTPA